MDPKEFNRISEKAGVPERIARGMEFLDSEFPGWEHMIDFEIYSFSNTCNCVAGQVAGWEEMKRLLGDRMLVAYGFDLLLSIEGDLESDVLHESWLMAIKERFDTGNLSGGIYE
jgi:hypothetical protein